MDICKICGSSDLNVVYEGRVRIGRFGNLSRNAVKVFQCKSCKIITLPGIMENTAEYYESSAYREEVDCGADVRLFFNLHDKEQIRNLSVTGIELYREKVVADIGCGAGSFLDAIRGYAKSVIAVEPSVKFRQSLSSRGYKTYPYAKDAAIEQKDKIDIAVSFSVLEHVESPLSFLEEIRTLLISDGKLIISTPNACDILLEALPDDYPSFFYRKAHLWYFTPEALSNILKLAGYRYIRIIPYHRFRLANFLAWMKDKIPKGDLESNFITPAMDAVWKSELERTMRCDYLFAEAIR